MVFVSIISPLHNKEKYVVEMIRSVQEQRYPDWELIIVENGSSDNSLSIAAKEAEYDKRIVLKTTSCSGPGHARNIGIQIAKGNWILFLDADDLLKEDYLEKQINAAYNNQHADIIVGKQSEFVDGHKTKYIITAPPGYMGDIEKTKEYAFVRSPWAVHAAIVKANVLKCGQRWRDELDKYPAEDNVFWYEAVMKYKIEWSDTDGAIYRKNTSNSRNDTEDVERWLSGMQVHFKIKQEIMKQCNLMPNSWQAEEISRMYENIYLKAAQKGCHEAARTALCEAERWLSICKNRSIKIVARKLLGIKMATKLAKMCRKIK